MGSDREEGHTLRQLGHNSSAHPQRTVQNTLPTQTCQSDRCRELTPRALLAGFSPRSRSARHSVSSCVAPLGTMIAGRTTSRARMARERHATLANGPGGGGKMRRVAGAKPRGLVQSRYNDDFVGYVAPDRRHAPTFVSRQRRDLPQPSPAVIVRHELFFDRAQEEVAPPNPDDRLLNLTGQTRSW